MRAPAHPLRSWCWYWIVRLVIGAAVVIIAASQLMAQSGERGNGHAQHHDMYKGWMRPDGGGSCCNAKTADDPNGDCRPTVAYLDEHGSWRARIAPGPEGWALVPPAKILHRADDGRCHVCERYGTVLCFQPCDPRS